MRLLYNFIRIHPCNPWPIKSHAHQNAWLTSPVRHRTLAPFGGITRIRFKGSPLPPSRDQTLSHCGSPAVCFLVRIGLVLAKSMVATGVSPPNAHAADMAATTADTQSGMPRL